MQLDIIICTFNRAASLHRLLESIAATPLPEGLDYLVTVADNASTDDTPNVVQSMEPHLGGRLRYLLSNRAQGKAQALNDAIRATSRPIVAFIDDDETMERAWFDEVLEQMADPAVDFIGGGYRPVWEAPPPAWVNHMRTRTAIGWADYGDQVLPFGLPGSDAMLLGGNAVIRRECLEQVGPYLERRVRPGEFLLGEDVDMFERLLAAGKCGFYRPKMTVPHYIATARLQKSYLRKWAFSAGYCDEEIRQRYEWERPRHQWFGLARHHYRTALQTPLWMILATLAGRPAEAFHHELNLWRFAGRWRFARRNS